MTRAERQLGDKLGPRLAQLMVKATIAARHALAPHEARVHAAATQQLIDRAGREVADLYAPILDKITEGQDLPDWLASHLGDVKSGEHQWKALGGMLLGGAAMTPISVALNNFLAAGVREMVAVDPLLVPDPQTLAQMATAGLVPYADAQFAAAGQGINGFWFDQLALLARQLPGVADLMDMTNRGELAEETALGWMELAGIPPLIRQAWINTRHQLLSPADAALATLRGNISQGEGERRAAAAGVDAQTFNIIRDNTGEPPAIEEMVSLWRRGEVPLADLTRAILQSRVRNEWIPAVLKMGVIPPTTAEVLDALVEGQTDLATAQLRYFQAGGDPAWFQTAFYTRGEAPTPVQAAEMANRGIIPWDGVGPTEVTYAQAFHEGAWRNKWQAAFRRMAVYIPPPREISTLVKEGGLTQTEAMKLWEMHGMTPAMAEIYWKAAHYQRTTHAHQLSVSEIERLYHDQAITRPEAAKMLADEGWDTHDIDYLLLIVDEQRERAYLERAISKVAGLYTAHHVTEAQASAALAGLGVASPEAEHLLKIWGLERADNVKTITAAEVADAMYYQIIDQATAQAQLVAMGYTAHDAWLVLSIRNHAKLPNEPR